MNGIKSFIKKIKIGKHHLDWIAGALSIPVLLTVIFLNLNNIASQKKNTVNPPTNQPTEKIIVVPQNSNQEPSPTTTPTSSACKKEVGPISITSPAEGDTVTGNPVCVTIKYDDPSYCSVVWSYRINNGDWSGYSNNSPCIYNMPSGNIKFDLRVQSTVSQDQQKTLSQNFEYQAITTPTATPSGTTK